MKVAFVVLIAWKKLSIFNSDFSMQFHVPQSHIVPWLQFFFQSSAQTELRSSVTNVQRKQKLLKVLSFELDYNFKILNVIIKELFQPVFSLIKFF